MSDEITIPPKSSAWTDEEREKPATPEPPRPEILEATATGIEEGDVVRVEHPKAGRWVMGVVHVGAHPRDPRVQILMLTPVRQEGQPTEKVVPLMNRKARRWAAKHK